jgi:hypothetical protein
MGGMGVALIKPAWVRYMRTGVTPKRSTVAASLLAVCAVPLAMAAIANGGGPLPARAAASPALAATAPAPGDWLKPEQVVSFPHSIPACLTEQEVHDYYLLTLEGKATKARALFGWQEDEGASHCMRLSPSQHFRVIDVHQDDATQPDTLVLEIVEESVTAADRGIFVIIPDKSLVRIL